MSWQEEMAQELARGREAERAGAQGKARTSARRAVGVVLAELQRQYPGRVSGRTILEQLQGVAGDSSFPLDAREAAERLHARLNPQFESPSIHPVADAQIIIQYVSGLLR